LKFTVAKYYTPSGRCIQATEYKDKDAARKTLSAPAIPNSALNSETDDRLKGGDTSEGIDGSRDDEIRSDGVVGPDKRYSARRVRNEDRKIFYTTNGRPVRDGGGIEVDVVAPSSTESLIETMLSREGAIFEFSNKWTKVSLTL
jgi:hypothetical protein